VFLFVIYACLTWYLAARFRRRWEAVAVVVLSALGLILINRGHSLLADMSDGKIQLTAMRSLMIPYAMLVISTAVFLAFIPRRPAVYCPGCKYDLAGLDPGPTACPECGRQVVVPESNPVVELVAKPDPGDVPSRRRLLSDAEYTKLTDRAARAREAGAPIARRQNSDAKQPGEPGVVIIARPVGFSLPADQPDESAEHQHAGGQASDKSPA
jgi:hypothetical protein